MSNIFAQNLNRWYRKSARKLPWRRTRDPYKIWVSEVMLQQTTVNAVIPYYQKWVKVLPTIESLAKAREAKVLKLWQGLGYYNRVKNLQKAARVILREHGGCLPGEREALVRLPGFGPYTTGAVLSIAFDKREPIIDANVRRVLMRVLALKGAADSKADKAIYAYLEKIMPHKNLRTFNQALMELGALVCLSKSPLCLSCPVKNICRAFQKGEQELIPEKKTRLLKEMPVVVGLIRQGRKYFVQKRSSKGPLADLWEFPGGKVEKGESLPKALKRELWEEIGVEVAAEKKRMLVKHFYTQFRVKLHVFDCTLRNLPQKDKTHRWVTLTEFKRLPMPTGTAKIVDKLETV